MSDGKKTTPFKTFIPFAFVLLLVISIVLPGFAFIGLFGLIVVSLALGFVKSEYFDDVAKVLGVYLVLILMVEGAHAITAYSYGIGTSAFGVVLVGADENEASSFGYGFVALDVDKAEVDESKKLQSQISWVSVSGSLILVVFGALYFVVSPVGIFPSIVASIMFIKHQAPFLANDQSMCIGYGWMSSLFAWFWFIVGSAILIAAFLYVRKRHKGKLMRMMVAMEAEE